MPAWIPMDLLLETPPLTKERLFSFRMAILSLWAFNVPVSQQTVRRKTMSVGFNIELKIQRSLEIIKCEIRIELPLIGTG